MVMMDLPGNRLYHRDSGWPFTQGTGRKGSLESYASATGVMLTAIEKLDGSREDSLLRKVPRENLDSRPCGAAIQGS